MASVADTVERGNAVIVTHNGLAIDDAGARAQPGERINDQREAAGEVIARWPRLEGPWLAVCWQAAVRREVAVAASVASGAAASVALGAAWGNPFNYSITSSARTSSAAR